MAEVWGVRNHLNLDDLEHTTDEEIDGFLTDSRKGRGPLDPGPQYDMRANSLWLYTRPDVAKLHMRMLDGWHAPGLEPIITASSFANMHTYINQGWEIGIENCTRGLQRRGVHRAQLMEAHHARPAERRHARPGAVLPRARHHPGRLRRATRAGGVAGRLGAGHGGVLLRSGSDHQRAHRRRPTRPRRLVRAHDRRGAAAGSRSWPRTIRRRSRRIGRSGKACSAARCPSR